MTRRSPHLRRFDTIIQATATRLAASDVTPAVLHRGRGPNHGDLLTADIHTPEGTIRLHAWANTQHTLTRLFAAGDDPNRTIQMTVTGRAANRIADIIAEHHRKGTI